MRVGGMASAILLLRIILITLNIFAAGPKQESELPNPGVQAWIGARIIDGTGKPAIENATLLIRDGRVEAVGKGVRIPAGAERIDAVGRSGAQRQYRGSPRR